MIVLQPNQSLCRVNNIGVNPVFEPQSYKKIVNSSLYPSMYLHPPFRATAAIRALRLHVNKTDSVG